jgi:hypothetical protein
VQVALSDIFQATIVAVLQQARAVSSRVIGLNRHRTSSNYARATTALQSWLSASRAACVTCSRAFVVASGSAFLIACGSAEGARQGARGPALAIPAAVARLPRSSLFIARVDTEKLRKSALFPAFISLLRARGFGKLLTDQPRTCGFSLWNAVREVAFATGPDGPALIAQLTVEPSAALDCIRKLSRDPEPGRVRAWGQTFAAESGLLFAGDARAVRKSIDDDSDLARIARFDLSNDTVAILRGDISELTIDGELHASKVALGSHFSVRFANADTAAQVYSRVSRAHARALEVSERSLSRDVLSSIHISIQGTTIDTILGFSGDVALQERYLDVLLGIAEAFLQDFELGT